MKGFKKFLIYFFVIIGILALIVLGVFAFMYLSPGTSVLGFEYVSYKSEETKKFTSTTELSVTNVQSVEICTENSDIYIYPNGQSGEIKVVEVQDFSGFAKEVNAGHSITETVENKQYEESLLTLKTFIVNVTEPTGWISKNNSRIEIYVSDSFNLNTIFAKTTGGNIYYVPTVESQNLSCGNLYLKTSNSGNVEIKNTQFISNYYLSTDKGEVKFLNSNSVSADKVSFTTTSGSLIVSNSDNTAVLNSALSVKSEGTSSSPYIRVDKLNGNLTINSDRITCIISEIGSAGNNKIIAISANESTINLGTVYGKTSILAKDNAKKNNVTINKLVYTSQVNVIETGEGNCNINNLEGQLAVETSSGNINLPKVTTNSDVCAYTKSGSVNVKYVYSNEVSNSHSLKVLTHSGNIDLDNVSCHLEITAMNNSYNSTCSIGFAAVSTSTDNLIDIANGQLNLYFINSGSYTRCRLVSTSDVNIVGTAIGSDISSHYDDLNVENTDYILDDYDGYTYSYRINYNKDDSTYVNATYNQMGKIIIKSTKIINVYAKVISV